MPDSLSPVKARPFGRLPVAAMVGTGLPVAVTVKLLADPAGNDAAAAEVKVGAVPTTRVNACVAFGPTPLVAPSSRG